MDGVIYIGRVKLSRLLVQLIKQYKFLHNNEYPTRIVLPAIKDIGGVIIEQENEPELEPATLEKPKPKKRKKKVVKYAVTS